MPERGPWFWSRVALATSQNGPASEKTLLNSAEDVEGAMSLEAFSAFSTHLMRERTEFAEDVRRSRRQAGRSSSYFTGQGKYGQ